MITIKDVGRTAYFDTDMMARALVQALAGATSGTVAHVDYFGGRVAVQIEGRKEWFWVNGDALRLDAQASLFGEG